MEYLSTKSLNFLLFLFVVSAYGVEVDAEVNARMRVIMHSSYAKIGSCNIDSHRVYQFEDETSRLHTIKVAHHTKSQDPPVSEFVVQEPEEQRKLSILMEFGADPQTVLNTIVAYSDPFTKGTATVSSWATDETNEGCIKIVAPGQKPSLWSTPVARDVGLTLDKRAANNGIITADCTGANVTQYVFYTPKRKQGVFVSMRFCYRHLNEVAFSWGTEVCGGKAIHASAADTRCAGTMQVCFDPLSDDAMVDQ